MIENFREIRRDGRPIAEKTSLEELRRSGLKPEKIVRIEWTHQGKAVGIDLPDGVLSKVLPGRGGVAVLPLTPEEQFARVLRIFDADGTERLVIGQPVNAGRLFLTGWFAWFEPARRTDGTHIGVVHLDSNDNTYRQVDIDVVAGSVDGVYEMQ